MVFDLIPLLKIVLLQEMSCHLSQTKSDCLLLMKPYFLGNIPNVSLVGH